MDLVNSYRIDMNSYEKQMMMLLMEYNGISVLFSLLAMLLMLTWIVILCYQNLEENRRIRVELYKNNYNMYLNHLEATEARYSNE